jgi:hypothetical protein
VALGVAGVVFGEVELVGHRRAPGVAPPVILVSTLPARQWHDVGLLAEPVARPVETVGPARVQLDARRLSTAIEITTLPVLRRQNGPRPTALQVRSAGPAEAAAALPLEATDVYDQFDLPLVTLAAPPVPVDRNPWLVVADAGMVVGSSVKDAGLATARFFSRFGRSVAGAF